MIFLILISIFSLLIKAAPLGKIEKFTLDGFDCGKFLSVTDGAYDIHWNGHPLPDGCEVHVRNAGSGYEPLCAFAMEYDVSDSFFELKFSSGLFLKNEKKFTASDSLQNVTYCAQNGYSLTMTFFTYSGSDSHIKIRISSSKQYPDYSSSSESVSPIIYRMLGTVGSIIMVALLISVALRRRRAARMRSRGIVLRRHGESFRDEATIALYHPAQNEPVTFSNRNTISQPPPYSAQPIQTPELFENQGYATDSKQYPDTAPPCYEDAIASSRPDAKH